MIRFVHPELFLLALPFVLLLRRRMLARPVVLLLRCFALACALAVLAEPYVPGAATGRDLVVVLDRSYSAPASGLERAAEAAKLARPHALPGDRLGLVTFGRDAVIETAPSEEFRFVTPTRSLDRDGTDLATALETALATIPDGRQGSLLLISDGESTGKDCQLALLEARRRGVRIDTAPLLRDLQADVAIEDVAVPTNVASGEPFRFTAFVRSETATRTAVEVLRDGVKIASGTRELHAGTNRIVLRDRITSVGVHRYEVRVLGADRVPENDRAEAVIRVDGPALVLCITPGGREDRLTRSLRASGVAIEVRSPQGAPTQLALLGGYRAVVLEDVPMSDLPPRSDRALAAFVRELGGGLLMTGGRASFGVGGWHRSAVEDVLPVSLEVRQEQRRFGLAMAIALDRSGSMAVSVASGVTKMDLANLGACAALEMLGPLDTVAVAAVDTAPHEVVAPTSAAEKGPLVARIRRIESMGGGIYVDQALEWGLTALTTTAQANKHLVVFGDAADSERPAETLAALPALVRAGITVSVIGLGSETDSDAQLLRDVARIGGGRVFFAADPADLPRVFVQETMLAARSSLCDQPTSCRSTSALLALGDLRDLAFPALGGYSIAWPKPGAQVGVVSEDDQKAPVVAFWHQGLGRTAAVLAEADGELSGGLAQWPRYGDFFATVARFLTGTEAPDEVFAELVREGQDGVLTLAVEKGHESSLASVAARLLGPDDDARDLVLERVGPRKLVARFPLRGHGAFQASVRLGPDQVLRVPPIMLPYSPEYAPVVDRNGGRLLLDRIARETGGKVEPTSTELMAGERESAGIRRLGWPLCWALLAFVLLEIVWRRLELPSPAFAMPRLRSRPFVAKPEAETAPEAPPSDPQPDRDLGSVLDRARSKSRRRLE